MTRDWQPDVMCTDLSTPAGLRTMLAARVLAATKKYGCVVS